MLSRIVLTIILGLCAGTVGGSLGLGPSIILLPGLIGLNIMSDYKLAVGTTLLAILPPVSILAVMDYYKRGKIDILIAAILCLTYIVSAKFGSHINKKTSSKVLKYATFVIFLLISLFFLHQGYTDKGV